MARKKQISIQTVDEFRVLDMGVMEIWDGADLALLRETLTRLISRENCRHIGVDMTYVKYIPSGFFGMLFDWHDKGTTIRLYSPQPHVKNMLWFRKFFTPVESGGHQLCNAVEQAPRPTAQPAWASSPCNTSLPAQPAADADDINGVDSDEDVAVDVPIESVLFASTRD